MNKLCGLGLLVVWLLPSVGDGATADYQKELKQYNRSIEREQKDLKSIQQQLKQHQKIVKKKKRMEGSILRQIQQVERQIDEVNQDYHNHQKNLLLVKSKITYLDQIINQNTKEIDNLKTTLANRVRLIYREKSNGLWKILATSENLGEALLRMKFLYMIASQNAFLISKLSQKELQLQEQQQTLKEREDKARELKQVAQKTLSEVKRHRQDRAIMLERIRQEREEHEQASKELEQASKRLTELIKKLERNAATIRKRLGDTREQSAWTKGSLLWPTRGRVVRRFGKIKHPRFNTYINHKGIDIAGTLGQNVRSVAKGYVLFAEWFEGYGRMVILDHGQGYNTVYAHLSDILVTSGEAIKAGQSIGQLGDSGTWEGPTLYFEIREQGRAIDPITWLEH